MDLAQLQQELKEKTERRNKLSLQGKLTQKELEEYTCLCEYVRNLQKDINDVKKEMSK